MAYDPTWSDTTVTPGASRGGFTFSSQTAQGIGGAVADIFSSQASNFRAKGNALEAGRYLRAAGEAELNARISEASTRIKMAQQERVLYQQEGAIQQDVASAGFTMGGSALDLLRQTHEQGVLQSAVLQQQGVITKHGYEVEAKNYADMAEAANLSAKANKSAATGQLISAGIKLGTAALPFL